jgi:hypothetical protein
VEVRRVVRFITALAFLSALVFFAIGACRPQGVTPRRRGAGSV